MLFQTMRAIFKPCGPNKHSDIPFSGKANRVEEVKERQNAYIIVLKVSRHYLTLISIRDRMREIPYYSIVRTDRPN